ncbi:hypothetical protein PVIIG_05589 [Plasmodium vivax India VII]|uniref:Uncharacterized protein n=1 Tax=Plasmodium vivax India VII TaxID=1077284 RepID=A0A0J9S376_PLAVI|nr:hypothetical protein PVIIG_05589 [Plasmodium vivax India VII]
MHNHRTETVAKRVISPGYELTRAGFDSLGRKSYPIHQELSNDAERDSSTILGSITDVLKDVQPAPILGVSGGMEGEDAYVEFLVVSMDNSQEAFQILMNMKEGILDMVQ